MYRSNTFEKYLKYFSAIPPLSHAMRKTLLTTRVFGPITIVFFFFLMRIVRAPRAMTHTCNRAKRPVIVGGFGRRV